MKTRKPRFVLISDIHFTVPTLELASRALQMALDKAHELKVPLVIAGDLLDSKAIIRAECANRLLEIFKESDWDRTNLLVGNHDMVNEKGGDHALNFLKNRVRLTSEPEYRSDLNAWLIPYQSDSELMVALLKEIPTGSTVICHQGVKSANMGHYHQDKTSLDAAHFARFRIVSGHYHCAQDIVCDGGKSADKHPNREGIFSYIGSPYTVSFSEANDPAKGFRVFYDDGSLETIPTNLRRHIVIDTHCERGGFENIPDINSDDLIWLKLRGPKSELAAIDKGDLGEALFGRTDYKLDRIPTDSEVPQEPVTETQAPGEALDSLIDGLGETAEQKTTLKALWREL